MPVKLNSKTSPINSKNFEYQENQIKTNSNQNTETLLKSKQQEEKHQESNENINKKDDSAYCSSISSTVSSQDAELNKLQEKSGDLNIQNINNNSELQSSCEIENQKNLEKENQDIKNSIDQLEKSNLNLKESLIDVEKNSNNLHHQNGINCSNNLKSKRNSIKDSIGELNQLLLSSTAANQLTNSMNANILHEEITNKASNSLNIKQRRTSSTSLTAACMTACNSSSSSPMFRPPSNLPPVENSEIIELDIDTYRLIMQDLQNTKSILHKLSNFLREPIYNDSSFNCNFTHLESNDEYGAKSSSVSCTCSVIDHVII
jgi:hypothetical protein